MYYDVTYLYYMVPGIVLGMLAQWYLKSTFARFREVRAMNRITGAEVAHRLLAASGVRDVAVERVGGFLSDHYDPSARAVRLSPDVHDGNSVAAFAVAAHEVGHVIQHQVGYQLMSLRQKLVGPARIGSQLAYFVVIGGIMLHFAGLAWFGVALFSAVLLFELVTVPVELNASARAADKLLQLGIVSPQEGEAVRSVLRAAAFTYIAGMIATALQLLYFISVVRRDDRR